MNKKTLIGLTVLSTTALLLAGCNMSSNMTTETTGDVVSTGVDVMPVATKVSGTITTRTQGKDGLQLIIQGDDGKEYSTAVSIMSDRIVNGQMDDLVVGTHVSVTVDDTLGSILIGNEIEVK